MPVNKSLYDSLIKQYGEKKGKEVYYGMENEGKKPFKRGLKTAKKEGHTFTPPKKHKKGGK